MTRAGLFLIGLLLGVSISYPVETQLQRANRMLHEFWQEVREASEQRDLARFTPQEYTQRLTIIENVVNQGILSAVKQPLRPSAGELEMELRAELSLHAPMPELASVFTHQTAGRKLYVVAYALSVSATGSRSWIGVVGSRGTGKPNEVLADVENSLANKTVAIQPLSPAGDGTLTFLARGIGWGDPHRHLTAIVYSFDGHKLIPLLTRSDLTEGEVKSEGARIELRFLTVARGPGYPPSPVRTEIYRLAASGIKLEKSWEEKRQ